MDTKLKANEVTQSQPERRALCIGFPSVYNGALVRPLLGPQALEVGTLLLFLSSEWFYFHLFYMTECHVRFYLKKLAIEVVSLVGLEHYSEAM